MNRKNIEDINPLVPVQQGMLYETIRAPESGIHIEQSMYTLMGKLEITALERAWQWGVDRHSILRTGFIWKEHSEPLQVTLRQVRVAPNYQDLRGLSLEEQRIRIKDYIREERTRGFELSRPPLMRLTLLQIDEQTSRLIWTSHHILMDGWSFQVLLGEIVSCYTALSQGKAFHLKPRRPYSDYIRWLKAQDVSQAEQFWRDMLHGFTKPTALGREMQGSIAGTSQERYGSVSAHLIPTRETAALQVLARQRRVTLSTILQGVWAILLGRYSGTEDVVFGVTTSGRSADLADIETMVGLFINTLPQRVQLPGSLSLWSWFEALQRHNTEMCAFEYSSAGQIHQWSDVPGTSLLYESILVVENYPSVSSASGGDAGISIVDITSQGAQTKYIITLMVAGETQLEITCVYDTSRLEQASIERILEHFQLVLSAVASGRDVPIATLSSLIPLDHIPDIYPPHAIAQTKTDSNYNILYSPIEEIVASVWSEVLGDHHQFDHGSNFFEFGGHSLVATQVISRLRALLGIELPLRTIFEVPTIARFAQLVELVLRRDEGIALPPLVAGERPEPLPLSFAQQRLWFLEQLEPGSTTYLEQSTYRVRGLLEARSLEHSLEALIHRHESLRTTFSARDGQPWQIIHPMVPFTLPVIDLQALTPERRAQEVPQVARQEARCPAHLEQGPLIRLYLLRLEPQEHVVSLTLHHIITDRWSSEILVRELITLYRAFVAGKPSPLAPLPIQYADYALWQRQCLQGEGLEALLTYWKHQLAGMTPLALPVDRRPASKSHQGASYAFPLSHDLSEALTRLSSQEQVTLFMTLLAAFMTLLHHLCGQDDIVVGTDVTTRSHMEVEGLIGFFVNQLVLRVNMSKNPTFRELLREVRTTTLEAYVHQELPFEQLVEALRTKHRDPAASLFQVKFILQRTFATPVQCSDTLFVPDVTVKQEPLPLALNKEEDLLFYVSDVPQGWRGTFLYRTDLFEAATITRIAHRFIRLIACICAHPDARLGMLAIQLEKEEQAKMKSPHKGKRPFDQLSLVRPQPVRFLQEPLVETTSLSAEQPLPLVITPRAVGLDLVAWAKSQHSFLETQLSTAGALLFRGFEQLSAADFERFAFTLCSDLFHENGEHVPADVGTGNLYTPVFYAPDKKLLWHTENSFNATWPMKIFFFCGQPAARGGETPIVDTRSVFERLDPQIREPFLRKGIMYVRTYGTGLGLPWQKVFRTEQPEEVEAYCRKEQIAFEWKDRHHLKTRQVRPAVLQHPQTGEWLWWNQAAHWHPACLEPEVRASLQLLFAQEDWPRNCCYGDGSVIEDAVMEAICAAYQAAEVSFAWRQGDLLLLDNMLMAHARNPYEGPRKIYVAMGTMVTLDQVLSVKE